jgi:hypothetical protein
LEALRNRDGIIEMRKEFFFGCIDHLQVARPRINQSGNKDAVPAVDERFRPVVFLIGEHGADIELTEFCLTIWERFAAKNKITRCDRVPNLVDPARYEFSIFKRISEILKVVIQISTIRIANALILVDLLFLQKVNEGFDAQVTAARRR